MHLRNLAIVAVALLAAEASGLPVSGLLALAGMLAVAIAGVLLVVSAESEAQRAFALGLGLMAGAALLGAAGRALPGFTGDAPITQILIGLACLAVPAAALAGLHILARGLAALPDRPAPTLPREWRRAEVLEPNDRRREPNIRASGEDDLDLFGGES